MNKTVIVSRNGSQYSVQHTSRESVKNTYFDSFEEMSSHLQNLFLDYKLKVKVHQLDDDGGLTHKRMTKLVDSFYKGVCESVVRAVENEGLELPVEWKADFDTMMYVVKESVCADHNELFDLEWSFVSHELYDRMKERLQNGD